MADLIHEIQGSDKIGQLNVAMIAGSVVSARRQFGKPVSCSDTSELVSKGIAHSQRGVCEKCQGAISVLALSLAM